MPCIQKPLRIEPLGNYLSRVLKVAMLALCILALAMISGCLAMAAPMALNVTRAVVSGVSSSARTAKTGQAAPNTEPCDLGERPLPRLIELRTDKRGATTYRLLNPDGRMIDRQAQNSSQTGDSDAWRAVGDLAGVHFQPPIQSQLQPNSVVFVAYAPAQVHGSAEESQLDALNHGFGSVYGTFDWDNRIFLYSVVRQLPCESAHASTRGESMRSASPETATETKLDHDSGGELANPARAEPEQPEGPQRPRR
jgi:hypothetical protein